MRALTQDTLTENNYRLFFGLALDVLIRPWEKLVLGLKYNEVDAFFFALHLAV
jgi:conserved oligomeric Golgi complex subunit 4